MSHQKVSRHDVYLVVHDYKETFSISMVRIAQEGTLNHCRQIVLDKYETSA